MAVYFDSSADYISIADNAKWTLTPVTDDKALSFKYKTSSLPDADGEYQVFINIDEGGGNKLQFALVYTGGQLALVCSMQDSGWNTIGYFYSIWTPSVNTEYDIVFNTGANNACDIYINGISQSLTYGGWVNDVEINPTSLRFGGDGVTIFDNITISHFTWWNDKLTQDEVNMLRWNPWWCMGHPDLLAYFPMDEGSGTICRDHSESSGQTATDGTFNGTPTWADDPPIMKMSSPKWVFGYVAAEAGWTGIINTIINPATINGISVANIKSVNEVE